VGLKEYFRKRRFSKTPEPRGEKRQSAPRSAQPELAKHARRQPESRLSFVIQEHHARALHYDFRLELDGVLKSWAVPKGPSLDPHEHHLAIQTEDHPYDYRKFEGVIPEGNYGAGNVIIWDEGWYEPRAETSDAEKTLRKELKDGHLTFVLHGKKLHGEFALIRLHNAKEKNAWLLIKKGDQYASGEDVTKQDQSIKSHKRVDDLGGRMPSLANYPKKAAPWPAKPMLTTLVDAPFSKDGWLFEIKWDGYRAIGAKKGSDIQLYSRNNLDFREKYPPALEALHSLKHDVMLDGEIVVVDEHGNAHFEWLQGWHKEPQGHLRYYVFDILWCDGRDLRTMPLVERKQLLRYLLPKSGVLHYSDHVEANGLGLFSEMQARGLEGMIAKRAASPYREETRGQDWLKIKTHVRQEVVIGGYTEPRGSRKYLGSLLVGVYEKGKLVYVGHSGGGIPDEQRKKLQAKLAKLERKASPFKTEPKPNAPVHWVKPELVCEMSFSEWTEEGYMRHPEFEGLREDKNPKNIRREKPKALSPVVSAPTNEETASSTESPRPAAWAGLTPPVVEPENRAFKTTGSKVGSPRVNGPTQAAGRGDLPFELTHLDKIFFPKHKYTKGDLIQYYESVAKFILPYLKDRPHSLNRMPDGIRGQSFYQKNNEHLPEWVPHTDIFSESNNENLRWMVGGDLATLLYMVQLGCVEINPWNSRIGHLKKPDWIVIDLDPEGRNFADVIEVARTVKEVCDEWYIPAHPKTSGKTGIHVYIPMGAKYSYEQAKNLAHLIALEVNKRQPKLTSVERMPEKRKHKIYVDFLQNREGQTLAAPYSVRPTPEATVSMPLHWAEIKPGLAPTNFTIQNALKRIKHTGDLWQPVLAKGINLPAVLARIEKQQPRG
jgi:bifunctional non-homologous end joining protein LigD